MRKNVLKNTAKSTVYQQCSIINEQYSDLFSEENLDKLARDTNFIKRGRKISASSFIKTLVYNEENQKSLSLLDLKLDFFEHANCHVSQEAIHKRFTPEAVIFLKSIFAKLVSMNLDLGNSLVSNSQFFKSIYIKDSSKFRLPKSYSDSYPSYGSYNQESALMNIQYEFDILSGNCACLELTKATRNDQADSKETVDNLKQGSLNIRDLGYITTTYLQAVEKKEAYYLNRLPKIGVYQMIAGEYKVIDWKGIDKKIKKQKVDCMELEVYLGVKEKIKTRIVITPVPDKIAEERIRKAKQGGKRTKGYQISKEYKIKARYSIYITNVPESVLSKQSIIKAYKLRWQIELVFKTWKSNLNIHKVKSVKKERMECQLIAKLIWVLINSKLFQVTNHIIKQMNPILGCSSVKFFKRAKRFSQTLRIAIDSTDTLINWYISTISPIILDLKIEKRLAKETHSQILNDLFMS